MAEMWISMGPQHPMTHGLWTLKVKVMVKQLQTQILNSGIFIVQLKRWAKEENIS